MIKYYNLGANKRLNEIVMAGSHDAGITGGDKNVQTQDLDIAGQATAGVRVFDLRVAVAAKSTQPGAAKEAELKSFHADGKLMKNETKSRFVPEVNRVETVTRTKLRGGTFGLGLAGMLQQAKAFVENNDTEFLILKFDKCTNWELIAEVCVSELAGTLYKDAGNLNSKRLKDLKGHVIVLFTQGGLTAIPQQYKGAGGILGIKNLSAGGAYDDQYEGMQYFGKGGTSVVKAYGKIGQNEKKQSKLMSRGATGDPDVMGMMYWTSTGVNESIRKRNDKMWNAKNTNSFRRMWESGLAESIESRVASSVDPTNYASASILKAFMPNIVMIDFADDNKCSEIYDLNAVAGVEITFAAQQLDLEMKKAQDQYAELVRKKRI